MILMRAVGQKRTYALTTHFADKRPAWVSRQRTLDQLKSNVSTF